MLIKKPPGTAPLGKRAFAAVNIGCGTFPLPDFHNVDWVDFPGVDEKVDLTQPLPWDDNSWDYIYASHVLEHLRDLFPIVEELLRVSKPNAIWEVHSPIGREAMECIDHCRVVSEITFRSWYPDHYSGSSWEILGNPPQGFLELMEKNYSRRHAIGKKIQLNLIFRVIK